MARNFKRFLGSAAFEVQASAAIIADVDSTGAKTQFSTLAGGNADGCNAAEIEINVTVAPATATQVQVFVEPLQHDGVGDSAPRFAGEVDVSTLADKYAVEIEGLSRRGNIVIRAIGFNLTASASMWPIYDSDV